jgi:hypothetical protein
VRRSGCANRRIPIGQNQDAALSIKHAGTDRLGPKLAARIARRLLRQGGSVSVRVPATSGRFASAWPANADAIGIANGRRGPTALWLCHTLAPHPPERDEWSLALGPYASALWASAGRTWT